MYIDFNVEKVAQNLCEMAADNRITDIENTLYYLKSIAENNLNSDYFRTFLKVLSIVCDY